MRVRTPPSSKQFHSILISSQSTFHSRPLGCAWLIFNLGGSMRRSDIGKWRSKAISCASIFALSISGFGPSAQAQTDSDRAVDRIPTATPIKHVIIIVGENRSFDHLFATYEPKNKNEKVLNLLSERIINKDGTPGQEF